ncbi:hypothetical protein E3N88_26277 [Mikania micrantha]|uniref:Tf2-1-like SH3-like domain-containing protein n=1 Tax=Mikania micrantha TaxID=192012 RepID=A0A5N6N9U7_9ASTR|nr:hypothetical protein E3N88_26277 [Mikania micrantha]
MEVPVGEHLRLDKYDSTMVDSQRCWQLSRWKYRWVNILDLINMTPQWWIARGAGNRLDGSTGGWKYRWVNILDLINMTPQWWIARGAGNCLDGSTGYVNIQLMIMIELIYKSVNNHHTVDLVIYKCVDIKLPSSHIIIVVIPVLECLHMKCYMGGNVVLLGVEEKLDNENWQIKRCDTFLKTREVKSRFIEPFRIIARIGNVAYRLELPEEIEWKVNQLRNKSLNQVKVQWNNIRGFDAMWGSEDEMKNSILFF